MRTGQAHAGGRQTARADQQGQPAAAAAEAARLAASPSASLLLRGPGLTSPIPTVCPMLQGRCCYQPGCSLPLRLLLHHMLPLLLPLPALPVSRSCHSDPVLHSGNPCRDAAPAARTPGAMSLHPPLQMRTTHWSTCSANSPARQMQTVPAAPARRWRARTVGQDVAGLLVGAVADVGHDDAAALELPAHAGVNTLGAPPALLHQAGQGAAEAGVRRRFGGALVLGPSAVPCATSRRCNAAHAATSRWLAS